MCKREGGGCRKDGGLQSLPKSSFLDGVTEDHTEGKRKGRDFHEQQSVIENRRRDLESRNNFLGGTGSRFHGSRRGNLPKRTRIFFCSIFCKEGVYPQFTFGVVKFVTMGRQLPILRRYSRAKVVGSSSHFG